MSKKLVSLRVDQQVTLDAKFIDAAGNVFTSVDDYKPIWSYNSNFFKAEFTADYMSATFTPLGQLGESNIVAVFNGLRDEFVVTVAHGNVTDLDVGVTISETNVDEEALAANVAKDAEVSGVQAAAELDAAASFTPAISVTGVDESVAAAEVARSADVANEQVVDAVNAAAEAADVSLESVFPELVNGVQLVELNGQTVEAVVRLSEAGGVAIGIDAPLLRPASESDGEEIPPEDTVAPAADTVVDVLAESVVQIGAGGEVAFVETQVATDSADVALSAEPATDAAPIALTTIEEVAVQETPVVEAIATTDAETAAAVETAVDAAATQQAVAEEAADEQPAVEPAVEPEAAAVQGEPPVDANTPVLATESRGPYQG